IGSAAGTADDACERVMLEHLFLRDAAQGGCQIWNQLRDLRENDVAGRDHRCASPAARSGHQDRPGLCDKSFGERYGCLRSFARCALIGPADRTAKRGHFDKPAQRWMVLHENFSFGKRLENFRKLSRTHRRIGSQRAFHKVGNAFLLESLERIFDGFEDYTVGSRRSRLKDGGAQAGTNPLQDLVATRIFSLRLFSLRHGLFSNAHEMIRTATGRASDNGSTPASGRGSIPRVQVRRRSEEPCASTSHPRRKSEDEAWRGAMRGTSAAHSIL